MSVCGDGGGGRVRVGDESRFWKIVPTCHFMSHLSGEITYLRYLRCWRRGYVCGGGGGGRGWGSEWGVSPGSWLTCGFMQCLF